MCSERFHHFISLIVFFCFFHRSYSNDSNGWNPKDFPNPMLNPELCGRSNVERSRICDPNNILTIEDKNIIEGYINSFHEECEMAVAIIWNMDSKFINIRTVEESSEKFARTLHDTWGVGDSSKQNGILIFLSIEDRSVFISTGSGVQKKLTSQLLNSVIDHMKPMLRREKYAVSIEHAVQEINLIIKGNYTSSTREDNGDSTFLSIGIFGSVVAFFSFLAYRESVKNNKLKKGRLALTRLLAEASDPANNRFNTQSCPICLEAFPTLTPLDPTASNSAHNPSEPMLTVHPTTYQAIPNSGNTQTQANDPTRPMSLPCGHIYCFGCLKNFLDKSSAQQKLCCPICREPISPDDDYDRRHPLRPTASDRQHDDIPFNGPPPPPPPRDDTNTQQRPPRPPSAQDNPLPRPGRGYNSSSGGGGGDSTSCSNNHPSNNIDEGLRNNENERQRIHYIAPELLFRMSRMRMLYPDVMTSRTHSELQNAVQRGSLPDFHQAAEARLLEVNRTLTDIAQRQNAARSGSRGASSSSFGGGFSSGGSGSRW